MDDYIVKDSSIWVKPAAHVIRDNPDATIKLGIVRETVTIDKDKDISYIVDVWLGGKYTPIQCFRTSKFGGIYNYEEFTHRGFELDGSPSADSIMDYKQGDCVIVAYLMGDSREGVILAAINHPGRPKLFKEEDGVAYQSEFNGINTSINKDGEYKFTFKGQPTNLDKLSEISNGSIIAPPEYNEDVGFSYWEWDKTGSYLLTDNANDELAQYIKVDKPNGKIEIISGKTSFIIDKNEESYVITSKKVTFNAADEWSLKTKATNIESTEAINLKAADIKTDGKWEQKGNMKIDGDIKQTGNLEVGGDLKNEGDASLGGGANALIYDIVLSIGTGNLGAPVISSHTFLKTVKTKAT